MKRLYFLLILTIISWNVFGEIRYDINRAMKRQSYPDTLIEEGVWETIQEIIPDRILQEEVFYQYKRYPEYLLAFLAVGQKESYWTVMRSHYQNSNGSYDVGPMGVNTYNLKSEDYKTKYFPRTNEMLHPDNQNAVLMVIGMNQLRGYHNRTGDEVFLAYNGGIGRLRRGETPDASYDYHRDVINFMYKYHKIMVENIKNCQDDWFEAQLILIELEYLSKKEMIISNDYEIRDINQSLSNYYNWGEFKFDAILNDNNRRIYKSLTRISTYISERTPMWLFTLKNRLNNWFDNALFALSDFLSGRDRYVV